MNKIFLTGNLTRDPEIKTYNGNITTAKSSVAVKRNFSKNGETDFFNVTAFGNTAQFLTKYFGKGSKVLIEGRLQQSSYTNDDGKKITAYEVIVENIEFGDSKKKDDAPTPPTSNNYDDSDDVVDLPF